MRRATREARLPESFSEGDLTRLELQIAKRADKLWRNAGFCRGRDLVHWLQAEGEVLERYVFSGRTADAEMALDL